MGKFYNEIKMVKYYLDKMNALIFKRSLFIVKQLFLMRKYVRDSFIKKCTGIVQTFSLLFNVK